MSRRAVSGWGVPVELVFRHSEVFVPVHGADIDEGVAVWAVLNRAAERGIPGGGMTAGSADDFQFFADFRSLVSVSLFGFKFADQFCCSFKVRFIHPDIGSVELCQGSEGKQRNSGLVVSGECVDTAGDQYFGDEVSFEVGGGGVGDHGFPEVHRLAP